MVDAFDGKPIETTKEIRQKVLKKIPKFVYYSDYGNLDSEIYLPRVIENFKRDDLGEAARAKAICISIKPEIAKTIEIPKIISAGIILLGLLMSKPLSAKGKQYKS